MTEVRVDSTPADVVSFGEIVVTRSQRLVSLAGEPVRLGSRAFTLLLTLLDRPGEVVSYADLVRAAWPDTVVEDSSLRVNVAALRKALGDGRGGARYIANVPGRGYSFVATLSSGILPPRTPGSSGMRPSNNLPRRLSRIIGRTAGIAKLSEQVLACRLLTVSGPGGVGKTTMALAIAERLLAEFAHGACFVDLASSRTERQLKLALAEALGLGSLQEGQGEVLKEFLRERELLLLLDNCEQAVEPVAELVVSLLEDAPGLHVVATSREPMRAVGEVVHRLAGLELPPVDASATAALALEFSAIQLFVERARVSNQDFDLTDADAAALCELCRRLDALPLAIELAAARVDFFGIQGLCEQLVGRFQLTTEGLRTKVPRHRTLSALLQWSYDLLTAQEQIILQRISVIKGSFSLVSAAAVALTEGLTEKDVMKGLAALAAKSLINVFPLPAPPRYRLLNITSVFAHDQLEASGQLTFVMCAYGAWLRVHATSALADWDRLPPAEWLAVHGDPVNDAWAVMDWAFSPGGSPATGVGLTVAYTPLAYELRRLVEHLRRCRHATGFVHLLPAQEQAAARLALDIAEAILSGQVEGAVTAEAEAAARVEAQLTTLCEASALRRTAASCLWASCFLRGDYPAALRRAEALRRKAEEVPALGDADRMRAQSLHALGHHAEAKREAMRLLESHQSRSRISQGAGTPLKVAVSMRIVLARIAWLEGHSQRAWELAQEALLCAGQDVPLARCQTLSLALLPLALWTGQDGLAAELADRLKDEARLVGSAAWERWAQNYNTVLQLRQRAASALVVPSAHLALLHDLGPKHSDMLATLVEATASDEVLARVEAGVVGWCGPEVLRARGELLMNGSSELDAEAAQRLFSRALVAAREQGALAWELRCATSLARHAKGVTRARAARRALRELLSRFDKVEESRDVLTAHAVLDGGHLQGA